MSFRLPGCHGLWLIFPDDSANSPPITLRSRQPQRSKLPWFRLFRFRSPLLTESLRFLFLRLLRCFTSPRVASPDYEFIRTITAFEGQLGFPIRKSSDQNLQAAPRSLSQLTTSFIASWHLGIHPKPFVAYLSQFAVVYILMCKRHSAFLLYPSYYCM